MESKVCKGCPQKGPQENAAFYRNAHCKDGYTTYCRACTLGRQKQPQPRKKRAGCSQSECGRIAIAKGLCTLHYYRARNPDFKVRSKYGTLTKEGYRKVHKPGHPNAKKDGSIFEHRFVMAEKLGRPLERYEQVHHKNGVRHDNRPENLELWVRKQPPGQRVEDLLEYARWLLQTYGPTPSP